MTAPTLFGEGGDCHELDVHIHIGFIVPDRLSYPNAPG